MTTKKRNEIIDDLLAGYTLKQAAENAGVCMSTIRRVKAQDAAFAVACESAMNVAYELAKAEMARLIPDGSSAG